MSKRRSADSGRSGDARPSAPLPTDSAPHSAALLIEAVSERGRGAVEASSDSAVTRARAAETATEIAALSTTQSDAPLVEPPARDTRASVSPSADTVVQPSSRPRGVIPRSSVRSQRNPLEPLFGGRHAVLDAIRGLLVIALLVANPLALLLDEPINGRGEILRQQLFASQAAGLHAVDLVAPWFLLIAGASIPFSFRRSKDMGTSLSQNLQHLFWRVGVLAGLGLIVSALLSMAGMNHSVLATNSPLLLACSLLLATPLVWYARLEWLVVTAATLLASVWWLQTQSPLAPMLMSPAVESGVASPSFFELLVARNWTGLLVSVLTAFAITLSGGIAGRVMRSRRSPIDRLAILVLGGLAVVAAGFVWAKRYPSLPLEWTASFALMAIGSGIALTGIIFLFSEDVTLRKLFMPLRVCGANSLVLYVAIVACAVGLELGWGMLPGQESRPQPPPIARIAVPVAVVAGLAGLLFRQRRFIRP